MKFWINSEIKDFERSAHLLDLPRLAKQSNPEVQDFEALALCLDLHRLPWLDLKFGMSQCQPTCIDLPRFT